MKIFSSFLLSLILTITYSYAQLQDFDCNFSYIKSEIIDNYKKINKIQAENIDNLIINDCLLNDIESKIEIINYCISVSQNLRNQFTDNLLNEYENLILQAFHKRKIINSYLTYADYWFYYRALFFHSLNDTSRYIYFIENSLMINPKYTPSLYEKSKWLLNNNKISEGFEIVKALKAFYQNNNDITMLNLLVDLYDTEISFKGSEFYKAGYYNESLMYFEYLDTLCKNYPTKNCLLAQKNKNLSKKGILQAYLSVAEQAIKAGKYSIAESFITKAEDYAALNIDENVEKSNIYEKYKLISQKYLQLSTHFKRNNEKSNSQYYLDNANRLCRKIYGSDCKSNENAEVESNLIVLNNETSPTGDNSKILTENSIIVAPLNNKTTSQHTSRNTNPSTKKQNILQKANDAFDNAEYEKALQLYETYKQQNENYKNIDKKQLDNYIQLTANQVILNKINSADFYIWTNNLNVADSILNLCIESKKKYLLNDNTLLDITLSNFKNKIEDIRCRNIEDEIETNINIIESKVNNMDFDNILSISNKIEALIRKTNCLPLIVKPFNTNTDAVIKFIKYRSLAKEKFSEANYLTFAEHYITSDDIFDVSKLETKGFTRIDILSFIDFNYNYEAATCVFKTALKNDLYELCFNILETIKNKNTSNINTKEMQLELAASLMDFQKKKVLTEKIESKLHGISKDKWFTYFNKNFKRKK